MTDDEIKLTIAESLGWQWWQFRDAKGAAFHQIVEPQAKWPKRHKGTKCKRPPAIKCCCGNDVPDYAGDLNAIRKAVAALPPKDQHAYAIILGGMVWEPVNTRGWQDWRDTLLASEATARQRAEAYLRTIGKWKESTLP